MNLLGWFFLTLMVGLPAAHSEASVLHWTTRLGHTDCDNHPVPGRHAFSLVARPDQHDIDDPLYFQAERTLASNSSMTLVVCNGEVHIFPSPEPHQLKLVVHLGSPLGHELTPAKFLQMFQMNSQSVDVEWKLPSRASPVINVYVPQNTALDLELGNTNLAVRGVRGDKTVNAGKGTLRFYVANAQSEYRAIVVDVAMGSFADLREPGRKVHHHIPFHTEFLGSGTANAHLQMAMGRIEIVPEQ